MRSHCFVLFVTAAAVLMGSSMAGAQSLRRASGVLHPVYEGGEQIHSAPGCNECVDCDCGNADCGSSGGGCSDCGCGESFGCCESCGGCSCGHCDCDPCSCGIFDNLLNHCGPWLRLRGDALALHRDVSGDPVAFGSFGTQNLDFMYEIGFRVAAEIRLHNNHSVEVVYFGLQNWTDDIDLFSATGNLNIAFNNLPLPASPFLGAQRMEAAYSSDLYNAEINYWAPVICKNKIRGSVAIGVRYLSMQEDFEVTAVNNLINHGGMTINTSNDMVSAHVGWMLNAPIGCRFNVRWEGKAGAALNIAQQNTSIFQYRNTADVDYSETVKNNDSAFIGDTSLIVSCQLGCNWSVYGGYYLLWIDGLALAPEQFNSTFPNPTNNTRQPFLNANSLLLLQGFTGGAECTW